MSTRCSEGVSEAPGGRSGEGEREGLRSCSPYITATHSFRDTTYSYW